MKRLLAVVSCLCLLTAAARAAEIEGQKPVMIVGDSFRFVPGSWAVYSMKELKSNTTSRMYFALNEDEKRGRTPACWMEIGVESTNNPGVVTRLLVEKTPQGPGRALAAIVQVEGFDPFVIPGRYLKSDSKEKVGDFQPLDVSVPASKEIVSWLGRKIRASKVVAKDGQGRPVKVIVSEEFPPLGLVSVESPEVEMKLEDWGTGAKSRITGKPIGFYRWIWRQIIHASRTPGNAPAGP